MTDTEDTKAEAARPSNTAVAMPRAPLRGGAPVVAIIPTDLEQVWRIATMAVNGAMAPDSLLKEKGGAWKPLNDAISACAIAIMAGAEMGLTPLSSLRSYAVVNGRPTLWGDGVKAVVRQSGLCEYIKTGSDETKGWCEAKRKDTGEIQKKEFTLVQAKRAGLTEKKGPWKDYPDMMMERRATFRCLNDLFADVLAGIVSAEEAADYNVIDEDTRSIAAPRQEPPEPPAAPEEVKSQEPAIAVEDQSQDASEMAAGVIHEPGTDGSFDMDELRVALAGAHTADEVESAFDEFSPQTALADDSVALEKAFEFKKDALARVNRPTEADGQSSMLGDDFPGDRPMGK